MTEAATKTAEPVTIKKYANRRLYNTGTSTYVTLEDLAAMVKTGDDFVAITDSRAEPAPRSPAGRLCCRRRPFPASGPAQRLHPRHRHRRGRPAGLEQSDLAELIRPQTTRAVSPVRLHSYTPRRVVFVLRRIRAQATYPCPALVCLDGMSE